MDQDRSYAKPIRSSWKTAVMSLFSWVKRDHKRSITAYQMFHQLYCLKSLKAAFHHKPHHHTAQRGEDDEDHIEHCLAYLTQSQPHHCVLWSHRIYWNVMPDRQSCMLLMIQLNHLLLGRHLLARRFVSSMGIESFINVEMPVVCMKPCFRARPSLLWRRGGYEIETLCE